MTTPIQRVATGPFFCDVTDRVGAAVEEVEEELGGAMVESRAAVDAVGGGFCAAAAVTIVPAGAGECELSFRVIRHSIAPV